MTIELPQIYHAPKETQRWGGDARSEADIANMKARQALEGWLKYLRPLIKRRFTLWADWKIYTSTSWHQAPRIIDQAKDEEIQTWEVKNTLARELTILIKWAKDEYIAGDQSIKRMWKLLLRIAWDREKRGFLKRLYEMHSELIDARYQAQDITPEIENISEGVWNLCVKHLELIPEEISLIESFSWEWKSTFSHCPYFCKLWILAVCILKMIDLDKE